MIDLGEVDTNTCRRYQRQRANEGREAANMPDENINSGGRSRPAAKPPSRSPLLSEDVGRIASRLILGDSFSSVLGTAEMIRRLANSVGGAIAPLTTPAFPPEWLDRIATRSILGDSFSNVLGTAETTQRMANSVGGTIAPLTTPALLPEWLDRIATRSILGDSLSSALGTAEMIQNTVNSVGGGTILVNQAKQVVFPAFARWLKADALYPAIVYREDEAKTYYAPISPPFGGRYTRPATAKEESYYGPTFWLETDLATLDAWINRTMIRPPDLRPIDPENDAEGGWAFETDLGKMRREISAYYILPGGERAGEYARFTIEQLSRQRCKLLCESSPSWKEYLFGILRSLADDYPETRPAIETAGVTTSETRKIAGLRNYLVEHFDLDGLEVLLADAEDLMRSDRHQRKISLDIVAGREVGLEVLALRIVNWFETKGLTRYLLQALRDGPTSRAFPI